MFDDLMLKNYRVFKYEKEEFDSNTSSRLYKATIRIPQLGEFITASRTSMRDAVRGACLKVKYVKSFTNLSKRTIILSISPAPLGII